MIPLSGATRRRLELLFRGPDFAAAERMLVEDCADGIPVPMTPLTPEGLERIRFAALRVSSGDLGRLQDAVRLANLDGRDLLVAAGFAHSVEAHLGWWPS